jgi:hypothetical protein
MVASLAARVILPASEIHEAISRKPKAKSIQNIDGVVFDAPIPE